MKTAQSGATEFSGSQDSRKKYDSNYKMRDRRGYFLRDNERVNEAVLRIPGVNKFSITILHGSTFYFHGSRNEARPDRRSYKRGCQAGQQARPVDVAVITARVNEFPGNATSPFPWNPRGNATEQSLHTHTHTPFDSITVSLEPRYPASRVLPSSFDRLHLRKQRVTEETLFIVDGIDDATRIQSRLLAFKASGTARRCGCDPVGKLGSTPLAFAEFLITLSRMHACRSPSMNMLLRTKPGSSAI